MRYYPPLVIHKIQIGIDPSGIQRLAPASKIILCLVDRLCKVYSFIGLLARLITSSAYGRTISWIRFSSPSFASLTVEITFRRYWHALNNDSACA